ncbi:MAG: hydrogenase formation protein HypD [Bacteroidota bacterium]
MKHIDEYRSPELADILVNRISHLVTREWTLMEVCGGQTHAIMKYNLPELLPAEITLIHGPGCPVCVTPVELIDKAIALGEMPGVILASFGDMMRVPGSHSDLLTAKARGGDIRMVYSPLDLLELARKHPEREVVFFAVGFETTAPAVAMAVKEASRQNLENFSVLVSHVLVPPAMEALLSSGENRIDAFLAAGHVCTIMGISEYMPMARKFKIPIVVTGFEPVDILYGIYMALEMLEQGRTGVENAYSRSVKEDGNLSAQKLLQEVFIATNRTWRGIGEIPLSGFRFTEKYRSFDASQRFDLEEINSVEPDLCMAGLILTGRKRPSQCTAFATTCTPEKPLGAPMVSPEGACAAYYRYNRNG